MSDCLIVQTATAELEASSMIEMFSPIGHSIEMAIVAMLTIPLPPLFDQIGNAVPPLIAAALAKKNISQFLNGK